jgi:ribosomal protein S18 acetylase RimI-like enzyme
LSDELDRIEVFRRAFEARLCTRTEPFAYGTAYLNAEVPRRWDSNFLWADPPLADVTADALVDEAERLLGGAGLAHREVVTRDDATGERLAARFVELGWKPDHAVTMVLRRDPDRRADADVREVDFGEARPLIAEELRRSPFSVSDDENDELVGFRRLLQEHVAARFFVAEADGHLASICELYAIDGVAQVESVGTLEEFRGRGLARAVVSAAVDAARARGSDLIFLQADVDDWPQELYRKLGFDPVARDWTFRRMPPEFHPAGG